MLIRFVCAFVFFVGLSSAFIQPSVHPYYLVNYNPQIIPWISKNPISTYGLLDFDLSRIVSK